MANEFGLAHNIYDSQYRDVAFGVWYKNGRPSPDSLSRLLRDDQGNSPQPTTLRRWMEEGYWHERAELVDLKAAQQFDNELATQRMEMMSRQAQLAQELQVMGMEYLRKNGIDNVANAIKAMSLGFEQEQKSRGVGSVAKIMISSDEEIKKKLSEFVARLTPESIEAEINDVEEDDGIQD